MHSLLHKGRIPLDEVHRIERAQFSPLPRILVVQHTELANKYLKQLEENLDEHGRPAVKDPKGIALETDYFTLNHKDMKSVVVNLDMQTFTLNAMDSYIQCICRYANSIRRPENEERVKANSPSPAQEQPRRSPRISHSAVTPHVVARNSQTSPQQNLSCYMFPREYLRIIDQIREEYGDTLGIKKSMVKELESVGLPQLDFLFIPYRPIKSSHWVLAGINFREHYIFVIDSAMDTHHPTENLSKKYLDPPMIPLYKLALEICPDDFEWNVHGQYPKEPWGAYGQWSHRTQTTDCSPNAPQQYDISSCGFFCLTSAMCLAFGYDLMCYNHRDINEGKRQRVWGELMNGGFGPGKLDMRDPEGKNGLFHYGIFEFEKKETAWERGKRDDHKRAEFQRRWNKQPARKSKLAGKRGKGQKKTYKVEEDVKNKASDKAKGKEIEKAKESEKEKEKETADETENEAEDEQDKTLSPSERSAKKQQQKLDKQLAIEKNAEKERQRADPDRLKTLGKKEVERLMQKNIVAAVKKSITEEASQRPAKSFDEIIAKMNDVQLSSLASTKTLTNTMLGAVKRRYEKGVEEQRGLAVVGKGENTEPEWVKKCPEGVDDSADGLSAICVRAWLSENRRVQEQKGGGRGGLLTESKISEAMKFPAQFPTDWTQKSRFLYKGSSQVCPGYSKAELVKFCKERDILGWENWEGGSLKVFRRWVGNTMLARRAVEKGDLVLPFEGILASRRPGQEEWKRAWDGRGKGMSWVGEGEGSKTKKRKAERERAGDSKRARWAI